MNPLFVFFLTVCFLLSGITAVSGRDSLKYDKRFRYRVNITNLGDGRGKIRDITYYDGFGRVLQEIAVHGHSVSQTDIVRGYVYDAAGRVVREYLPFGLSENGGAFVRDIASPCYRGVYDARDRAYAFTLRTYESSPWGRELKCVGPGYAWHSRDRGTETEYGFNADSRVRMYYADALGNLVNGGYYKEGTLDCVRVTDEDGRVSEVYTDRDGREVLSVSLSSDDTLETYRVYDDYGRLSWVLPPKASARLGGGTDAEVLERYTFHYVYDLLDRLVEKKLPGCAPVYMVYDGRDRLVLSQDGEHRRTDTWSYMLYDDKNREVEKGEVSLSGVSRMDLQLEAGKSVNYIPEGVRKSLQYFEYDGYTDSSHVFVSVPGYASGYYSSVCGKLTGVRKRSLSDGRWYRATCYYDERGREIQRSFDNALGGVSRVDRCYDFVDNVIRERESHGMPDGRMDVLESSYIYDKRSRLLERRVSLNGGKPVVVRNGYDELGRETARLYGDYAVAYRYNVRSWKTLSVSRDFHESLYYESGVGSHPGRYNGSISGVEWRNGGSTASLYLPEYDGFDRLTGVEEYRQTASGWEKNPAGYEERGITYDRNGNIKSLQRTVGGKIADDLAYTYIGNRLTELSERVRTEEAGDVYAPGASENGTYEYDLNGNLINDSRRGLEYGYNFLNLLENVSRDGQPAVKYDWLADGTKLGVRDVGGENGFVYVGSLIYRAEGKALKLETAHFGDGVILVNENSTQKVDYFICDHLGSVRVIVDAAGTVKERNDYYPFGARQKRDDYPQLSANRWKYNGKELQVTGDLGFLDYGARMYDMSVGRWFSADPLSESSLSQTPYHYCYNDPLNLTDLDGMYADHWMYDLTSGNVSWMSDLGGSDYQFISFVHPGSDGGYVLDKQISLSGSSFYIGLVSGGLLASNVDYWKSMPSDLSGYQGYRYDLSDLRMRLEIFNGSSHHLKVALLNWESCGIAEPLTSENYWATYGHTVGMLNLWSDYMSAGVGLSAGAMGGKGQFGQRRFRYVPMALSSSTVKGCGVNPFRGKTFSQIDEMFQAKGFIRKGINPSEGKGSYINPTTGFRYYLDKGGVYKKGIEKAHVDIWYNGHPSIEKVKFFLEHSPKEYVPFK